MLECYCVLQLHDETKICSHQMIAAIGRVSYLSRIFFLTMAWQLGDFLLKTVQVLNL